MVDLLEKRDLILKRLSYAEEYLNNLSIDLSEKEKHIPLAISLLKELYEIEKEINLKKY
jgi:hypothetical protein